MKVKEKSEKVGLKLNIQKTKIMASSPITSWQMDRETVETVADFIFFGSKVTADCDCSHEIKRRLLLGTEVMINLDSMLKSWDITLPTKVCLVKAMVFPVVQMWELDYKESWAAKNWCFWTVVLEKTLESLLDCKEIKPISPKGNQSWIFIGKTDAEAESPILWPAVAKNWLIGKDIDPGKDWRQEEKGMTLDEVIGWHHQLLELTQAHVPQVGDAIQPSHPLSSTSPPEFNLSSIRIFSNESVLCIRWPKYWSFSFSISLSNEYSGLISFRTDWLDLLAVQGTLESSPTPQFKSSNSLVISFLYGPTLTSIHDYW